MRLIVIHSGPEHEVLLLTSLLIGLKKKYGTSAKILWVGDPAFFCLVKYNKRVKKCFNINQVMDLPTITNFYGSDACINISLDNKSGRFASMCGAKQYFGFDKDGPIDRNAEFAQKVIKGEIKTNKTALDLYYSLIGSKWKGEGYGLSYYPRNKQSKECGTYLIDETIPDCDLISLPDEFLPKFDTLNQFAQIVTDDIFVLHAGLALRKKVTFRGDLPYKPNFTSKS